MLFRWRPLWRPNHASHAATRPVLCPGDALGFPDGGERQRPQGGNGREADATSGPLGLVWAG